MKWSAAPRNRTLSEPHGRCPCDWGIRADKTPSPTRPYVRRHTDFAWSSDYAFLIRFSISVKAA